MSTSQITILLSGMAAFCLLLSINPQQLSSRGRWWSGLTIFCIGFWSVVAAVIASVL